MQASETVTNFGRSTTRAGQATTSTAYERCMMHSPQHNGAESSGVTQRSVNRLTAIRARV
jgi:hypothetical protein